MFYINEICCCFIRYMSNKYNSQVLYTYTSNVLYKYNNKALPKYNNKILY